MRTKMENDAAALRKKNEDLYKEVNRLRQRLQLIISRDSGKSKIVVSPSGGGHSVTDDVRAAKGGR